MTTESRNSKYSVTTTKMYEYLIKKDSLSEQELKEYSIWKKLFIEGKATQENLTPSEYYRLLDKIQVLFFENQKEQLEHTKIKTNIINNFTHSEQYLELEEELDAMGIPNNKNRIKILMYEIQLQNEYNILRHNRLENLKNFDKNDKTLESQNITEKIYKYLFKKNEKYIHKRADQSPNLTKLEKIKHKKSKHKKITSANSDMPKDNASKLKPIDRLEKSRRGRLLIRHLYRPKTFKKSKHKTPRMLVVNPAPVNRYYSETNTKTETSQNLKEPEPSSEKK